MKDIVAGKIIGFFCNLSLTGWFFMPLFQHDPGTFQAKLNSAKVWMQLSANGDSAHSGQSFTVRALTIASHSVQ